MRAVRRVRLGFPACARGGAGARRQSSLTYALSLDTDVQCLPTRATKIVCTLGPSSASREQIRDLILSGMDIARINAAHGDKEGYRRLVDNVRLACDDIRKQGLRPRDVERPDASIVSIALDIKGPEIRVGRFAQHVPMNTSGSREIPLARFQTVRLSVDPRLAAASCLEDGIFINYPSLARQVQPGSRIYIDDGNVELVVASTNPAAGTVMATSVTESPLLERKGVNLPGIDVDLPSVTAKDEVDIATARELGLDILFASFVTCARMVHDIRARAGPGIGIVSKIESHAGIDNYDEILVASDGIMVARGDLGVQIPPERVFLAQKRLIARANLAGKPVITATQMLESMITNIRPTRAECVDVASAVLDGTDAVMLSGETAKGRHPVEAAAMMSRICLAAEAAFAHRPFFNSMRELVDSTHPRPLTVQAANAAAAAAAAAAGVAPASAAASEALMGAARPLPAEAPAAAVAPAPAAAAAAAAATGCDNEEGDLEDGEHMTTADVETLASAAVLAAFEVDAAFLLVLSVSGRTAKQLCKYRPQCPIFCVTADEAVARQLQLHRGAHAVLVPAALSPAQMKRRAIALAKAYGIAKAGDRFVAVHGAGSVLVANTGVQITMSHVK